MDQRIDEQTSRRKRVQHNFSLYIVANPSVRVIPALDSAVDHRCRAAQTAENNLYTTISTTIHLAQIYRYLNLPWSPRTVRG